MSSSESLSDDTKELTEERLLDAFRLTGRGRTNKSDSNDNTEERVSESPDSRSLRLWRGEYPCGRRKMLVIER